MSAYTVQCQSKSTMSLLRHLSLPQVPKIEVLGELSKRTTLQISSSASTVTLVMVSCFDISAAALRPFRLVSLLFWSGSSLHSVHVDIPTADNDSILQYCHDRSRGIRVNALMYHLEIFNGEPSQGSHRVSRKSRLSCGYLSRWQRL